MNSIVGWIFNTNNIASYQDIFKYCTSLTDGIYVNTNKINDRKRKIKYIESRLLLIEIINKIQTKKKNSTIYIKT